MASVESFDVIVCGLGAMGSATTYQLAKTGARVLGVDRLNPPHTLGSTHGDTRITRLATGEGPAYVPLVRRSHELWREVEGETDAQLLTAVGVLVMAPPGIHTRHHGKTHFLETTIAAARAYGIAHEVLDAQEITHRFPQFRLDGDESGYFEPGAGYVRPEAAVAAHLELAARNGATLRRGETLVDHAQDGDGVTVLTSAGQYSAGVLVLAVGPWLGELIGPDLGRNFAITRQVTQWYAPVGDVEPFLPRKFPVFIWDCEPLAFYGFPAVDGPDGGVKVAAEQPSPTASVAEVARGVSDDEQYGLYDNVVGDRLPGLARRLVKAATCLYTTTPDGDFVIDRHPDQPAVLIVSACSGHGFKHSPAIGEAVAAMALGRHPPVDVTPFGLERLRKERAASAGQRAAQQQRQATGGEGSARERRGGSGTHRGHR